MRSTRAAAAVARLNQRSEGRHYLLVLTNGGQFKLRERTTAGDEQRSDELPLDDFVHFVNALGPQKTPRITKNDAAFAKQLLRKSES